MPRAHDGRVVIYRNGDDHRAAHDHATCAQIARRLALLKGYEFAGDYHAREHAGGNLYFVPMDTLIGVDRARRLGIVDEHDVFGGVVPHPFVATKSISHPLADDRARAPAGWSHAFARRLRDAVLPGFAAFAVDDAMRAGMRLLDEGAVRVKRALGIGGSGQYVVRDRDALAQALAEIDADELSRYGVSLEQHLEHVTTFGVGQIRVGDLVATYYGTQRVTTNNAGAAVYGGSDLVVARGGLDALMALDPDPAARQAIDRARRYDDAASDCFPGLFASRRNYDVAEGTDGRGRRHQGVLEQSWRIGGASGAEMEALRAFRDDPGLAAVRANCVERYGNDAAVPDGASVYFSGDDARVGRLVKYATVEPYADA